MAKAVKLRPYRPTDQAAVIALIQRTIRLTNRFDYQPAQLAAWSAIDQRQWPASVSKHTALVAETATAAVVGFADMAVDGYLDRLFVAPNYQHFGIGQQLVMALEQASQSTVWYAQVSLTARPFFLKMGYQVVRPQQVTLRGQIFLNYLMSKAN